MKEWQGYALALFAVASGQAARIGQRIEQGRVVGWRDLFVMGSIMPAFGSIAGAASNHYGWPIPVTLVVGTAAGWTGFATMRFIVTLAQQVAGQLTRAKAD